MKDLNFWGNSIHFCGISEEIEGIYFDCHSIFLDKTDCEVGLADYKIEFSNDCTPALQCMQVSEKYCYTTVRLRNSWGERILHKFLAFPPHKSFSSTRYSKKISWKNSYVRLVASNGTWCFVDRALYWLKAEDNKWIPQVFEAANTRRLICTSESIPFERIYLEFQPSSWISFTGENRLAKK